jgi:AhpC/TSA family
MTVSSASVLETGELAPTAGNQEPSVRGFVHMDRAIDFELPDPEGKPWALADHLAGGPVVLVFYRGDW